MIRYRDAILALPSKRQKYENLFFNGDVYIGKIPPRLINDIFFCNASPHCRNVIANTTRDVTYLSSAVTRREIKSVRFAMNKLSSAGIHSRRNSHMAPHFLRRDEKKGGKKKRERAGPLMARARFSVPDH